MTKILQRLLLAVITLSAISCKKYYMPDVIAAAPNYLVVEGFINLTDTTHVTLSRTINITSPSAFSPELKALVTIESNQGTIYPLTETGKGQYVAVPLNLNAANQYRLHIVTAGHSTYVSDFIAAKVTPAIDTLFTRIQDDGIHFSISTHDAANQSRYYKWNFAETWEFNTYLESPFYYDGNTVVARTPQQQVHHCWGNLNSTAMILTSTLALSKDVIADRTIDFVPASSEKLHVRFSLLIQQYALTKEAYDYNTKLKSNTETIGTITDPQPTSLTGNLHNVINSAEPVIGFISAGTISQKRIFISDADLPGIYRAAYLLATPFNPDTCPIGIVMPENYSVLYGAKPPLYIPVLGGSTYPLCADCTLRGHTAKPAFWP